MGLLSRLFKRREKTQEPEYELEEWDEASYGKEDFQIDDQGQREQYVRECLEQIAEASKEVDNLQFEYNMVTSYLKDMEEVESLPDKDKARVKELAKKLDSLEKQQSGYKERAKRLSDEKYRQMERMEEEAQEGYDKLREAEDQQDLIRRDLRRLEGEKNAYLFRRSELQRLLADTRTMTVICIVAMIVCILLLLVLQYGFQMNAKFGYLAVAAIGAVAITLIFIKHGDAVKELARVENGIGRIIKLHNAAKIRYVNNTRLLEYLYLKYNVSSAGEFGKDWERYQQEKEERLSFQQTEKELDESQKELIRILRKHHVEDPMIWLHQTAALLDKKEMVEMRHNLIIRRQSLRRRMDYNKEVMAGKAQSEIRELVENHPEYAREVLGAVEEFEKEFS
ncbi:MAG: hypothetical protein HFI97_01995 [Lachnospiraceae bacterium]|jgi:hypothetical protein|nr:hypothetical protein [Lachnospiraceae bacterium]MCI9202464.1 hypothetical protein [Lachnospiraceae bacterium]